MLSPAAPWDGALGRGLETELTLSALHMAMRQRQPSPGGVHHSDAWCAVCPQDYVTVLRGHGFQISMSRRGNPYDNALCESFLKTLKYEQVYREDYRDYAEANTGVEHFLEKVYNEKRLHSALGYRPPAEFEASLVSGVITGVAA